MKVEIPFRKEKVVMKLSLREKNIIFLYYELQHQI